MSRLTINSNIASLNAQRNFTSASKKLTESYTRLSSGLRINKASDDAAGLSISESLKADTRLFNQGIKNLNDGVSLLNIADSALGELSNITIRLRELATQSANGTLGSKQRSALDQEAQSLSKEFNRIARTTEFNGQKIFDSDFGSLSLAAGGGRESLIVDDLGGVIGTGTFQGRQSLLTVSNPRSVTVGDFNNDGVADLVAAYEFNASINVFIGNGNGTFKSVQSYASGVKPTSVTVGDFNSDGVYDLISTDTTSNTISLFFGNSDGTFQSRISTDAGLGPLYSAVGDFNNDGYIDIASAVAGNHSVGILLGNNNGTFKAIQLYATGISPTGVTVGDFNSDGILDVASSDAANSLSILIGNSNGTFKARISVDDLGTPYAITKGDFNNDGILDLASADNSGNTVSIYFGNNNGTFQARKSMDAGTQPYSINIGDFNGDGVTDLVSGDLLSSTASVFLGNMDGTFKSRQSYTTGLNPYSAIVGDLNNDGVSDLITPDASANSLSILFGNSGSGVAALQSFSLKSKLESKSAMTYLETALTRLTKQRGEIGAFQSRIGAASNNLQQATLAYREATSRIIDADVAEESSKLVANQILQQAAASVLAQANQQPRLVLQLLVGI